MLGNLINFISAINFFYCTVLHFSMFVNIEIKLVSTSIDKAKKNVVDMNYYKLH